VTKISKTNTLHLAGTLATFIIGGETYAFNSTHDAWCEDNKVISNLMFGNVAVPLMHCRPSQLMVNKRNHYLYGVQILNAPEDPFKNFFVCH
jgi:hypothetical protein